jgi:hypothetical protein
MPLGIGLWLSAAVGIVLKLALPRLRCVITTVLRPACAASLPTSPV